MSAADGYATFRGTVSFENNGGFSSVRSPAVVHDLSAFEGLVLRVRGDGKRYGFRLKIDASFDGVSYQFQIEPPAGEWTEIFAPFSGFHPCLSRTGCRGSSAAGSEPDRDLWPDHQPTGGPVSHRHRVCQSLSGGRRSGSQTVTGRVRNPVNRKKLPMSKWTAVSPVERQKHFLVVDWVRNDEGEPTDRLVIEAVLTQRLREIHWRDLEDSRSWRVGWR